MTDRDKQAPSDADDQHVIVIGAGFAGATAVRELAGQDGVRVTWIDRQNYHLFLPLLYQVATATLEAHDIAQPARDFIKRHRNVQFVLGTCDRVDLDAQTVWVDGADLHYDYLIVATGSETARLGVPGVEEHAFGLKSLNEAMEIRNRLWSACEEAAQTVDRERIRALLTFAVVGGGPTGVEMAGALAEVRLHVLPRVYPEVDPNLFRIMLIDSSDRPLSVLSEGTSAYTARTLEEYGVELRLDTRVAEVTERGVRTQDGDEIDAYTVVWAAGVQGSPIEGLPEPDKRKRIETTPWLSLPDYPNVYIVGDVNGLVDRSTTKPFPQVAPVATQQGRHAARNILHETRGERRRRYRYRNLGTMITVGRHRAAAERGRLRITGFPAWFAWLFVHLIKLVGGRNQFMVLVSWLHMYFTRDFAVRVLYQRHRFPPRPEVPQVTDVPVPQVPSEGPDPDEPLPGDLAVAAQEEYGDARQQD
jgi:NADH:ubiquinone reductase (H+-translocating)